MKTLLEKLDDLRDAGLHDIMFRNAGVGCLFYEGGPGPLSLRDDSWKQHLIVRKYYPTFEAAIEAEWVRRSNAAPPVMTDEHIRSATRAIEVLTAEPSSQTGESK